MNQNINLSKAMANVDREEQLSEELQQTVAKAVATKEQPVATQQEQQPIPKGNHFNTHSNALAGLLIAQQRQLTETLADYDAEIEQINKDRDQQIASIEEKRKDALFSIAMIRDSLARYQGDES